ncbi:unnamed protein product [Aphanomyces euteiches]|uniref:AAA+ ATPase domain-containing protein n=1 Tax=Aphanomyces euteiches TaxID=100861 RepID=A0A6G0W9D6_9STRA|nr:hypothetical protein Ae201684_017885 [Aphanomyces euteiches]KAH9095199.1 hypothetical protein Ae201684P_015648 [Aphanomyces euteiches]KAH9157569.1 hypothetical protein AeRB84_000611 [Aphanomyces euteiches]
MATAARRSRNGGLKWKVLALIFAICLCIQGVDASSNQETAGLVEKVKATLKWTATKGLEKVTSAWEWLGFGDQCRFVDHPSVSVRKHLQTHLKAQDRALETIIGAIESWEFSRSNSKDQAPLVLAITGPTGTGKTETSNLLAEGLFKRRKRLEHSEKEIASGLIVFRGEDFSDNFTNPVTEYQEQIKTRLAEHLSWCSGKAIVVFDEVQKVIPHTLDVLTSAMSKNAQITYYKNGVARKVDCSNVIFVLISDIGVAAIEKLLMQYDKREEIPPATLENEVKKALDSQWKRLQFGKMIHQVVPFLPFEQRHVVEIIELKLAQLSSNYQGKYWRRLDFDAAIAPHLSRLESVLYLERRAVLHAGTEVRKIFAKYGARDVESGPIQQLKSKLMRHLRPFNTQANLTVTLSGDEVEIVSCFEESKGDAVLVSCVTKWKGRFK